MGRSESPGFSCALSVDGMREKRVHFYWHSDRHALEGWEKGDVPGRTDHDGEGDRFAASLAERTAE